MHINLAGGRTGHLGPSGVARHLVGDVGSNAETERTLLIAQILGVGRDDHGLGTFGQRVLCLRRRHGQGQSERQKSNVVFDFHIIDVFYETKSLRD